MDTVECLKTRMSIRAFTADPVPRELLLDVIDAAKWSPSYKNSQPWEVTILSGEKKSELSRLMTDLLEKGEKPAPDLPEPLSWPAAEQGRIDHLYRKRAEAFGVDLADQAVVKRAKKANFGFYGAPHAIYLHQDSALPLWSLFDIGLFAQSVMLAAHARGLGTVPQAFPTDYSPQIKEFLGLPPTKRLVLCLSIGYPDRSSKANSQRTDRAGTEEIVTWAG